MQTLRRALILTHRYLGIPLSVLFVLWFVTGIAMIYVGGMPTLSAQARLERLPALDLAAVRYAPAAAAAQAASGFGRVALTTVLGRPAYRFASPYGTATVFADTGEPLDEIDVETARDVAAQFLEAPASAASSSSARSSAPINGRLQLGRDLPLYKFAVDDGAGTEVYVSPYAGEVRLVTTTKTRTLAWIATIPHWFYITPLRTNQPHGTGPSSSPRPWAACSRCWGSCSASRSFTSRQPFRWSQAVRYQGWMRWHYISGAFFGVFALTWVFSGLLSMEPFDWANADSLEISGDALTGGPVELEQFPAFDAAVLGRAARRPNAEGARVSPHRRRALLPRALHEQRARSPTRAASGCISRIRSRGARSRSTCSSTRARWPSAPQPFASDTLLARLAAAAPDATIVTHELLTSYDSYYYSRNGQAALPVLRVKFDDPLETWVYVDPELGQLVASIHRLQRVERWLYNGLHSLDFGFWYDRRPLWDIGMILLSRGRARDEHDRLLARASSASGGVLLEVALELLVDVRVFARETAAARRRTALRKRRRIRRGPRPRTDLATAPRRARAGRRDLRRRRRTLRPTPARACRRAAAARHRLRHRACRACARTRARRR